jgi:CRP/FNR family cyclic AMP-dependent transcriptional regulator
MDLNLLDLFKHVKNPQDFTAGETIIAAGMTGGTMYVVLEGEVEIRAGDMLPNVAGPGTIVGDLALIDSGARSANVIAKCGCRLAPVDQRQFVYMVQQTPCFALHVMKLLADRLRRMDARG